MRIVFFGNQHMGVVCLRRLREMDENVIAVVAHPDDDETPFGPQTVTQVARAFGMPVHQPRNVNAPEFVQVLRQHQADLFVVVSFRQILKKAVIDVPPAGVVNVHPSLLPKYRGRANLVWAMLRGETRVGVTVHYIDEGIDTGPILVQKVVDILPEDTIDSVLERVTGLYPDALQEAIGEVGRGNHGRPQDHSQATYFPKRSPTDGLIEWASPAHDIHNLVRAVTRPYPGAFTYAAGRTVRIWETALVEGAHRTSADSGPGELVDVIDGAGVVVQTADGCLLIKRIQVDDAPDSDAWKAARALQWTPGAKGIRFHSTPDQAATTR